MQCAGMIPLPVSFFPLSLCRIGCKEEIALALQSAIAIPSLCPMEKRSELGHGSCARAGAACRAREHKDATLQPPCRRLGGKILLLRSAASLAEARPDDGRGRGHWRGRDEGADRPGAMAAAVERRRKARRRPAAKLAIVSFIVTIIVAVAAAVAADGRAGARWSALEKVVNWRGEGNAPEAASCLRRRTGRDVTSSSFRRAWRFHGRASKKESHSLQGDHFVGVASPFPPPSSLRPR